MSNAPAEQKTIDRLIINSPYEEPRQFWQYSRERESFSRVQGRRPAGYMMASAKRPVPNDPGVFVPIPLVNQIRLRVKAWREAGYPGVTAITKRLLEHWRDPELYEERRFFFCQIEAAETLIWLAEAPEAERRGIEIPGDGGAFRRLCTKLATGGGKTLVMAMVIAWQVVNKVTYPQDRRFSKHVLVIAPGLTIRSRLQVLLPAGEGNYYDAFNFVPVALRDQLRQGKVLVRNWHVLNWDSEERISRRRSVDKRGAKSDEAYVREVLGEMASARNLLVINDEAHHAWRVPAESKIKGVTRDELEEATKWVGGLDRIHKVRGVLSAYDFSATPFAPTGKTSTEEALFDWIVSDFGLNDAIESGLVKTPRVVVRDDALPDAKTYKSKLYHIYMDPDVHDDLNRSKAEPHEPLPDLVTTGYNLLGFDWRETLHAWQASGHNVPPVLISVCNNTATAARLKHAFDHQRVRIEELCDPVHTLHIDSKVLKTAEEQEEPVADVTAGDDEDSDEEAAQPKLTKKQQAELLRLQVDTVGQPGRPGAMIRNVISVGMLSEGWDAKTVTHIMGLRAFSSQLLCEQVVGRGLRRTTYEVNEETGLFDPEYVNIFGVPFTYLPHEDDETRVPLPPMAKTRIEPDPTKLKYEITWPNVVRINHAYRSELQLDWDRVQALNLNAAETPQLVELAPVIEGKPDFSKVASIDLEGLARENRFQRIVFETARDLFDQLKPDWKGSREYLLAQLVSLAERFIGSDLITITPGLFHQDPLKRRLMITLNMTRVVNQISQAIREDNAESLEPVFDRAHPLRSTGSMPPWYTGKPTQETKHSHINRVVLDSTWEATEAFALDRHRGVDAWAKNDHLGLEILYIHRGVVRKYRPDFLVRLASGDHLVLETKGRDTEKDKAKRSFLDEWVRAINQHGGFGRWRWDVSFDPGDIQDVLARHTAKAVA